MNEKKYKQLLTFEFIAYALIVGLLAFFFFIV